MSFALELYIQEVIKEKRKGFIPFMLKLLLRPVSWGYKLGITCRNWAFDKGLFKRYFPPVPVVISIGNIVAGGTGKTPVTGLLAHHFTDDTAIAILSRGYRSPAEKLAEPLLLSKGEGPGYPASFCGDEPYMLSLNLPKAYIYVGRDRQKAADMAAKEGIKLILLDDGLQHRQLARDFELIVLNGNDPFGKGYFLPRGFLREGPKCLSRASLIIVNHCKDLEHFELIKKKISKYSSSPVIGASFLCSGIYDLNEKQIESIRGKKVGIFCGLGNPENFRRLVSNEGAVIVSEYYTPDHLSPAPAALMHFAERSAKMGAELLLCTEKDKVKLKKEIPSCVPIAWMKGNLSIVYGNEQWDQFIQCIKDKLANIFPIH